LLMVDIETKDYNNDQQHYYLARVGWLSTYSIYEYCKGFLVFAVKKSKRLLAVHLEHFYMPSSSSS
jgi:hypothetical protein